MVAFARSWNRSRNASFALLALVATLAGCSILETPFASDAAAIDEHAPQRPARIRLSPPQVFTREQLINDRLREDTFLRSQLDASATAALGSSLSRDLQTISALTAQVSVSVDPALKLNFDRQSQQAQLQQSIDLVQLRAQLLSLRQQIATPAGAAAIAAAASGSSAPSTSVSSQVSTASSDARIASLVTAIDSALTGLATLGDSARTNGAATTFFDDFRDRYEGRQEIRGLINANSLDDSHDLEGNALYHLQFNATILPGVHKSQFGIASVTIEPPTLKLEEVNRLYYTWLAEITNRLNLDFGRDDDEKLAMSYRVMGPASRLYEVATMRSVDNRHALAARHAASAAAAALHADPATAATPSYSSIASAAARAHPAFAHARAAEASSAALEAYAASAAEASSAAAGSEIRLAVPVGMQRAFEADLDLRPVIAELAKSSRVTRQYRCFSELDANEIEAAMDAACTYDNKCRYGLDMARRDAPEVSATQLVSGTIGNLLAMEPAIEMGAYALGDRSGVTGPAKRFALDEMELFQRALVDAHLLLGAPRCYTPEIREMLKSVPPMLTEEDLQQIRSENGSATADSAGDTRSSSLYLFASKVLSGLGTDCPIAGGTTPCVYAFPYSTDPSSRVQRVSTVASAANAFDLAIAASANLPSSGASIGAGADYARRAAGRVDAIERVPEIIGFSGASTGGTESDPRRFEFGWLFGPRMSLDAKGNQVRLRQEARTVPVSVDLSLPAWWPRANLHVRVAWKGDFEGAGDVLTKQWLLGDALFKLPSEDAYDLPVNFRLNPASLDALTVQLSHATTAQGYHQARIDRVRPDVLSLCGDATATGKLVTMQIYGVDLWRNPQVVVGGQTIPSASISVLPDMSGIAATIDTSTLSRSLIDADPTLIVATGHGVAETSLRVRSATTCEAAAGDPTVASAVSSKATIVRVAPAQISACDTSATLSISGLRLASDTSAFHLGSVQASSSRLIMSTKNPVETTTLVFDRLQSANKGLTSVALTMATENGVVSVPIDVNQACMAASTGAAATVGAADRDASAFLFSSDVKITALTPVEIKHKDKVAIENRADFDVQVSLPIGKSPSAQIKAEPGAIRSAEWADKAHPPKGFTLSKKGSSWVVATKQTLVKQSDPLSIHLSLNGLNGGTSLALTATPTSTGVDKIAPQSVQVGVVPPLPAPKAPVSPLAPAFTLSTALHVIGADEPDEPTQTLRIAVGFPVGKPTAVSISTDGGDIDHVAFTDSPPPVDVTITQTGDTFKLTTTDPVTSTTKPVNLDVTLKNLVEGQTLSLKGSVTPAINGKSSPQLSLPIVEVVPTTVKVTAGSKSSP